MPIPPLLGCYPVRLKSLPSNPTASAATARDNNTAGRRIHRQQRDAQTLDLPCLRRRGSPDSRRAGGIDSEMYDIVAKADTPLEMTRERARPCLETLLADRFRLAIHRGTRQGNVFSLSFAQNGPKFREHPGPGRSGISSSTGSGKVARHGHEDHPGETRRVPEPTKQRTPRYRPYSPLCRNNWDSSSKPPRA
jgi:hypothetical protein